MNLQEHFIKTVRPLLQKQFAIANALAVPRITKIVVNTGLGEAMEDKKILKAMSDQLGFITGQKPKVTRAKKAIATYKLRAGMPIGLQITLHGARMYQFLDKLIAITFPRVRDFRGIRKNTFDRRGNLNIGFQEITVFPEVKYETLDKVRGLEVAIVTTAQNDEQGYALLKNMGMPFVKDEEAAK